MAREHGSHVRYVVDRCRCTPCTAANAAYKANRSRQIAYGRWQPYVDAEAARAHVRMLGEFGIGWERAAQLAGISNGTMSKLLYGGPGDRPPSRRIRAETAEKIVAVEPSLELLGATVSVDPAGTRGRVQALVALGWSQSKLAAHLGVYPANFAKTLTASAVQAGTARKVRALYDELWNQAPPEDGHRDKIAASRARNHARSAGWLPPQAWDDDLIDVPDGELDAELARRVALMDYAEVCACNTAVYYQGDTSPLTIAAACEYRRRRRQQRKDSAA